MKIALLRITLFSMLFLAGEPAIHANDTAITVTMDDTAIQFTNQPFIKDGVTMVQFRPVFEKLGYTISWNTLERSVTGTKPDTTLKLKVNSLIAQVNGDPYELQSVPQIINNVTFVPLRFIAEASGSIVEWDRSSRNVIIISSLEKKLLYYLQKNEMEQVKALVRTGLDFTKLPETFEPLFKYAAKVNDVELLLKLIQAGGDFAKFPETFEPLFKYAIHTNDTELLLKLIQAGGDLNTLFTDDKTPLMLAILENKPEVVQLLLKQQLTLDLKNKEGFRAVDYARAQPDKQLEQIIEEARVKYLDFSVANTSGTILETEAYSLRLLNFYLPHAYTFNDGNSLNIFFEIENKINQDISLNLAYPDSPSAAITIPRKNPKEPEKCENTGAFEKYRDCLSRNMSLSIPIFTSISLSNVNEDSSNAWIHPKEKVEGDLIVVEKEPFGSKIVINGLMKVNGDFEKFVLTFDLTGIKPAYSKQQ